MGKQNAFFADSETEWLCQRYHEPHIQKLIANGGSFLNEIADKLDTEYGVRFGSPREGESEQAWQKRRRNATSERKEAIDFMRKAAETEEEAAVRADENQHIKAYIKDYKHRVKQSHQTTAALGGVPPLTPVRTRKVGGVDAFYNSPLRLQMIPDIPKQPDGRADVRELRKITAEAYRQLTPEQRAEYEQDAEESNLVKDAENLEFAGSQSELIRAMTVPSIKGFMDAVGERLRDRAHWVMASFVGGPDEDGVVKLMRASTGTDELGRDYFTALAAEIGWTEDRLKIWSLQWMHGAVARACHGLGTAQILTLRPRVNESTQWRAGR
ncbi:hypothetical protein C8Q79DRAFT_912109 [Trametes meyenii]|nr:hypothetical protein C8Q79DRAFT_912109 [Trametes meyenii]